MSARDEMAKGLHSSQGFDEGWRDWKDGGSASEEEGRRKEREVYQRFLRGEDISDDEDEVEEPTASDEDEKDSVGDEQEGEEEEEEEGSAEALKLFTDLLQNTGGRDDASISSSPMNSNHQSGEMVLAHLMHGGTGASPGPLTRRRWNALVRNEDHGRRPSYNQGELEEDEDDGFFEAPVARRRILDPYGSWRDPAAEVERPHHGAHNLCVICTTETRDIICWPCRYVVSRNLSISSQYFHFVYVSICSSCHFSSGLCRCLAMCDNCREVLGSKSARSMHRCPCCRQT